MAFSRHNSGPLAGTGPQRRPLTGLQLTGLQSSARAFAVAAVRPSMPSVQVPSSSQRVAATAPGARAPAKQALRNESQAKAEMGKGLSAAREVQGAIRQLAKDIATGPKYNTTPERFANTFPQPGAQSPLIAGAAGAALISADAIANPLASLILLGQAVPPPTMPAADRKALCQDVSAATGNVFTSKQVETMLTKNVMEWDLKLQRLASAQANIEGRVDDAEVATKAITGAAAPANVMHNRDAAAMKVIRKAGIDPEALRILQIPPDQTDLTGSGKNGLTVAELRGILEKAGMHQYLDTPRPAADFAALLVARNPIVVAQAPRRSG